MAERFVGKWKLESSDNFDHYMKAVGEYQRIVVFVTSNAVFLK